MNQIKFICETKRTGQNQYYPSDMEGISFSMEETSSFNLGKLYKVTLYNKKQKDFNGIIHIKAVCPRNEPAFFMPGYIYNRNTADKPSSGRKAFPRIKIGESQMPESEYFFTRSDRLAEPVTLIYDNNRVCGLAANPFLRENNKFSKFCGFSCNINDEGNASAGYTIGYENAPWLFVQTATVLKEPVSSENQFTLSAGSQISFDLWFYDYPASSQTDVLKAIEHAYFTFHEKPRAIQEMDSKKAVTLLASAIRDYAWLSEDKMYSGFVYDRPDGFAYNKIGSITWTNGLSVVTPMLMAANKLNDPKIKEQCLIFINEVLTKSYNPKSGFLYEAIENGKWTEKGWWYNGMHSGGHSGYLNGQAVYYLLKAYLSEKSAGITHQNWLDFVKPVINKMNCVKNTDNEYPFSMSVQTGAGLEYDSMGGAWCLAATALYAKITGDTSFTEGMLQSEKHYFEFFVQKMECYGGPLDTDKAVDNEGILAYIRAVKILHEITGKQELLVHLEAAIGYECSFKLGYNTPVQVSPLCETGWSSCGGSITSVANPHIHPMSSTIIDEMKYFLEKTNNKYVQSRLEDTIAWSLQTFNTKDKEYGYGKPGWMSERFCFCQGLVVEKYPDGKPAGTWFALMPWAAGSLIEGLINCF